MELQEVSKLQEGEKIKVSGKALKELDWQKGDLIVQFVNDAKDAIVLMRARDVLDEEKIREKRGTKK